MAGDQSRPHRRVWCPDWPVTTARLDAGLPDEAPIAVVTANRVVACSHAARSSGVRRGLRRREAQARCPELAVLPRNEAAEARIFEPVVAALESIAPGVEITRPGPRRASACAARPATSAARPACCTRSPAACTACPPLDGADVLIGIADGAFAAEQAARRGLIVDPGGSPAFLADLPIETLDPSGTSPLIDLLRRLGMRTLGAFAALPPRDVLARFGPDGAWAHRQAGGRDDRPVSGRRPPVEFTVTLDLEPPVDRVDTVAFSARGIAEQFVADLAAHGLACTCLELQALQRERRGDGAPLAARRRARRPSTSSTGCAGSWRAGCPGRDRPTGGIARVRLVPIETVPTGAHQQALWGGSGAEDERAAPRAGPGADAARARLGADAGARGRPRSRPAHPAGAVGRRAGAAALARAAVAGAAARPGADRAARPAPPGAGARRRRAVRCGSPSAARCPSPPALFAMGDETPAAITSWAGPWPVDERWWSAAEARRVGALPGRRRARPRLPRHRHDDGATGGPTRAGRSTPSTTDGRTDHRHARTPRVCPWRT